MLQALFEALLTGSALGTEALIDLFTLKDNETPETIYDYGGPSPHSSSSLISTQNATTLQAVGEELEWTKLGWSIATLKENLGKSGSRKQATSPAGFGWYKEERRMGQRVIGEGGMYI